MKGVDPLNPTEFVCSDHVPFPSLNCRVQVPLRTPKEDCDTHSHLEWNGLPSQPHESLFCAAAWTANEFSLPGRSSPISGRLIWVSIVVEAAVAAGTDTSLSFETALPLAWTYSP